MRFHGVRHFPDPTTDNQDVPAFDRAGTDWTSLQIRANAREPQPVLRAGSGLPPAE